jgi:hypothetical protein
MDTILYLSAYLNSYHDNHKNTNTNKNNFEDIENYYQSIMKNNLNSVIIVDDTDDEFINKYSNNNISFIKKKEILDDTNIFGIDENIIQPHDLRFILFFHYITQLKQTGSQYEYFVMTDISDVIIIKDLEDLFNKYNNKTLFIGKENDVILRNEWFHDYFNHINSVYNHKFKRYQFKNKTILNCGIVAGHIEIIIKFLMLFVIEMIRIYQKVKKESPNRPLDMFLINFISYYRFDDFLYVGDELNTKFGHYLYDETKYIMHK